MSSTFTRSDTFTRTHARHLASKVAADLHQMGLFYGSPAASHIDDLIEELTTLLVGGYLNYVEYGFRREGRWILCLRYTATSLALNTDDRSGRVFAGTDITGATWYSYLSKSSAWWNLSAAERQRVEELLPIKRNVAPESGTADGYWTDDKTYSRNGVALGRRTFRPL